MTGAEPMRRRGRAIPIEAIIGTIEKKCRVSGTQGGREETTEGGDHGYSLSIFG